MASVKSTFLGRGMYRFSEVARYACLNQRRVRSWFVQRTDQRLVPVFSSDFERMDGEYLVSFLDMIDAWIAGKLRTAGVSMRTVRAAHSSLKHDLGTIHPFAHSSIYTDGKRIFADAAQYVNDPTLTEVVSRQTFLPKVRESLELIDYSLESSLAERWNIAVGVTIDPAVCFGQPVVKGTGVSTYVLHQAYLANRRDSELVAELFGIAQKEVGDAVDFEDRYGHQLAA